MKKSAFTLLELMIVVVIMGVVYTLSTNSFAKLKEQSTKLTFLNLKEHLLALGNHEEVELLCLDDCSTCTIYVNKNKVQELEKFLDSDVEAYRYEFNYGFTKIEPRVYFNEENIEEDVCFSYKVDKEGVGDQVLIAYKDKYYDYTSYFENTLVYDSLEDASSAKKDKAEEVSR